MLLKNVLITGEPGVGKSTLIKRLVEPYGDRLDGFLTEEILEDDLRVGFRSRLFDGRTGVLAHKDYAKVIRVGKYGVDPGVVNRLLVPAINFKSKPKAMLVIDEVARMQTWSENFRFCVYNALNADRPVLATVHTYVDPFTDMIKGRPDCTTIEIKTHNRDQLYDQLSGWLRSHLPL